MKVSLAVLCQFYNFHIRKDERKPDVSPYRLIKPPTVQGNLPVLFRPRDSLKSNTASNDEGLPHSNEAPNTLNVPKSVPSTPLRALGASPYSAAISTTPLSEPS